jgi:hypothetical protein
MRSSRLFIALSTLSAAVLACALGAPATPTAPPTAPPPTPASPTAEVVSTATSAPSPTVAPSPSTAPVDTPIAVPTALLVVQRPDNQVVVVGVDGQTQPVTEAPTTVYALTNLTGDISAPQQVYALGPAGAQPLAFIEGVSYGVAAWSDTASGEVRLAWDHYAVDNNSGGLTSQILVSDPGGAQVRELITETGSQRVLRVVGWAPDGQQLFYSKEPLGLGGYILFSGVSSLWAYDWASGEATNLVPEADTAFICLDDYDSAAARVAHHCTVGQISVLDLNAGQTSALLPPPEVAGEVGVLGDTRFSPSADRVAFALARNNPENEQGWVAVSDGLAGPARLVATADAGDFFDVIDWLDDNTLILQATGVAPGVWLVNADGSQLRHLADGHWLGLIRPGG